MKKWKGLHKRIRTTLSLVVVMAVVATGLTIAQPRPAKAICETPATSVASIGLWLANSFGFLGDFGGTIADYLTADVQSGQDEVVTRVEETSENVRIETTEWHNEEMRPASEDAEAQLGAARMSETASRGMMMDGQELARHVLEGQAHEANARQEASYSNQVCQTDAIVNGPISTSSPEDRPNSCTFNGGIYSDRYKTGLSNTQCENGQNTTFYYECCGGEMFRRTTKVCGEAQENVPTCGGGTTTPAQNNTQTGINFSAKASEGIARGMSNSAAAMATAEKGTPEAEGPSAVIADKWNELTGPYCDPEANGGVMPCQNADPAMINKDISIGSKLLWGEELTIDMNREANQDMMMAAKRAFVDQVPAQAIPEDILANPTAVYQFNMIRSNAARKNAIHAVLGQMMSDRSSRPDADPLTAVQDIRVAANIPRDQTSDIPSMFEITQALFQERYATPDFVTQLTQNPAELLKNNLDVATGHLMQWNLMYKRLEKLSVMYASEFARDLEYSEPEFDQSNLPISNIDRSIWDTYDPVDPNDLTDEEKEEIQECSIVDFEIPNDPFGCTTTNADLALSQLDGNFITPVRGHVINSDYGPRGGRQHRGIDIAAPTGTPIYATRAGTVTRNYLSASYGWVVYMDHGNGVTTRYAHMNQQSPLPVGSSVEQGQYIGPVGSTGRSSGPHLHFEIRVNGQAVDPRDHFADYDEAIQESGGTGEHDDHDHDHGSEDTGCPYGGVAYDCSTPQGREKRPPSEITISDNYIQAVMEEEGYRNTAYDDGVGNMTIGIGHLIKPGEPYLNMTLTDEQVMDLYRRDNEIAMDDVRSCVTAPLTQSQFEALTSMAFNMGRRNFCRTSLVDLVNAGDYEAAQAKILDYVYSRDRRTGRMVVLPGLPKRRARESALFGACDG